MTKPIVIGTRGSELALWQANRVKELLAEKGHDSELKIIHSTGDKDRKAKLHELGLVGVFTKELDDALLLGEIDIAVHSLKDVPTSPPKGIVQAAVLERANPYDVLISGVKFKESKKKFSVATGSLRRRAFWQNKFPEHDLQDLRGNVPTRLKKLTTKEVDGVILAKAGLDRLGLSPKNVEILDWMTPAPAQGIIGVFCLNKSKKIKSTLDEINDKNTEICAHVERDLLKTLEGGCTAPIGAYAQIIKRSVEVKSSVLSTDGKTHVYQISKKGIASYDKLGKETAKTMLENGAKEIMKALKEAEINKLDSVEIEESIEEIESSITEKEEIELKPIAIKKTVISPEKPVEEKEAAKSELKSISIKKTKTEEPTVTPELEPTVAKKILSEKKPDLDGLPMVLCLKKLTPPRINAGRKLGLGLTGKQVIETLPEFDSYAVSTALKSTNNWVFSSLNSVSAITSVLKNTSMIHKHVFCVGSRVANFFEGKVKAIHQVNSVSEITEVAKASEKENFMWFHGNKSDMALIEEFEVQEMTLNSHSVYRTEASSSKIENLEEYKALMFFSPSGVDSFNEHNYIPESAVVSAIGRTTAEYIAQNYNDQENTELERIIIPETYEYDHLLKALQNHFKTNGKD